MQKILPPVSVLFLLLIFIYQPVTQLNFARFDDDWMILNHDLVHPDHFNWGYLEAVFGTFNSLQYSPLNTLFYQLIYRINGYDPYWFHLFCFTIHVFNTGLIYVLSKMLFSEFKEEGVENLSIILSIIWAVHPLNVESVVWISASKIPLFSFFSLLSFISFIYYVQTKRSILYWLSWLTFILSCLVKDQAVVLPAVFIIYLICTGRLSKVQVLPFIWSIIPFVIISVVFGLVTIKALTSAIGEGTPMSAYPFQQRIILLFYCLSFYCYSSLLPIGLHYHYAFPMLPGSDVPWLYYIFPVTSAILITFVLSRWINSKRKRMYGMGLGIFIINIILCLQIVPLSRPAIMADRYMYLSLYGILFIAIPFIYRFFLNSIKHTVLYKLTGIALCIGVILIFTYSSRHLVEAWANLNIS